MSWTTPEDLRFQVRKLWDKGLLTACLADGEPLFPRPLRLKAPTSTEMTRRFAEVRQWIARLESEAGHYRVVRRVIEHRVLGANSVPAEIWVDSLQAALDFIGKRREAERFSTVVQQTRERLPDLIPWLQKRPLMALEQAEDWSRLLDIVAWLRDHPRPGVYLRQVDIPGVHSKFIEGHRLILTELLDRVLPEEAVDRVAKGIGGFCRRYGFCDKPVRLRFRFLDPDSAVFSGGTDQDITVTDATFSRLDLPVTRVFITENEINFLAFPHLQGSMVVFGAGYGFEMLEGAKWMQACDLYYWGDIDTHGFAILDQLRAVFPHAVSLLMDRETLLSHRLQWGMEPQPETRELHRLTEEERMVYDDLRSNRFGNQVRLEQEKIGFVLLQRFLDQMLEPGQGTVEKK